MNSLINTLWVVVLVTVVSLLTVAYHIETQIDINPHAVRHVLENK